MQKRIVELLETCEIEQVTGGLCISCIIQSLKLPSLSLFDRGLSRLLHADLHWLDVPERVQYKLGVTVRRCQQHKARST